MTQYEFISTIIIAILNSGPISKLMDNKLQVAKQMNSENARF